jgi:hypothetical protein
VIHERSDSVTFHYIRLSCFSVSIDDRQYENQLPLLCSVVPELSRVEYNGFEMRLRLQKQMASLEWPCLLEDGVDREIRWLVYNVDHLDQEENEDSSSEDEFDEAGPPIEKLEGTFFFFFSYIGIQYLFFNM